MKSLKDKNVLPMYGVQSGLTCDRWFRKDWLQLTHASNEACKFLCKGMESNCLEGQPFVTLAGIIKSKILPACEGWDSCPLMDPLKGN